MSKDFEREYKEYLNAQAPDLWDRIEKGIAAVPVSEPTAAVRNKRLRYYRLVASAAACLAALCLIVPVYRLVNGGGKNEAEEEMAATEEGWEATAETDMATAEPEMEMAAAEEQYEAAAEELAAVEEFEEEAAETESYPMETGTDSSFGEAEEGARNGQGDAGAESSQNTEVADRKFEETEDRNAETPAESESILLETETLSMSVTILTEATQIPEGLLYEAVVTGSPESNTIPLLLSSNLGVVLEKDVQYAVTLQKQEDTGYYVVIGAETAE